MCVTVLRVVQCLSTSCSFYRKISKSKHHLHYSVVNCTVFVNFLFILQGGYWKGAPCVLQCCELYSVCQLPVHFAGRLLKGSTVCVTVLWIVQCLSTSCSFYREVTEREHRVCYSVVNCTVFRSTSCSFCREVSFESCPVFVNFLCILQGGYWKGALCVLQCCELYSISVNLMKCCCKVSESEHHLCYSVVSCPVFLSAVCTFQRMWMLVLKTIAYWQL